MPSDPETDPFRPPAIPTEVGCLHCGQEYESYLIEWRVGMDAEGKEEGFWCCPTPGCGGKGFGFDILPTDPTYQDENGGWVQADDEDEEDDDFGEEYSEADSDDDVYDGPPERPLPDDDNNGNDIPF
jgi:hypothetical protein